MWQYARRRFAGRNRGWAG